MKLVKPNSSHKKIYEELILEWSKTEDINNVSPWVLFEWSNFEEFLNINNQRPLKNQEQVPAQLYFAIVDDKIVWAIDIRFNLNNKILSTYWGHIWYGIIPIYRKKWYATKMLELWLVGCKKIGLKKVLVCCDTDNIASAKTIEKNWGTLEKYITVEGIKNSRYWIDIK